MRVVKNNQNKNYNEMNLADKRNNDDKPLRTKGMRIIQIPDKRPFWKWDFECHRNNKNNLLIMTLQMSALVQMIAMRVVAFF